MASIASARTSSAAAAPSRSSACLTVNCQPRGSTWSRSSTGKQSSRSISVRAVIDSNSRGSTATRMPGRAAVAHQLEELLVARQREGDEHAAGAGAWRPRRRRRRAARRAARSAARRRTARPRRGTRRGRRRTRGGRAAAAPGRRRRGPSRRSAPARLHPRARRHGRGARAARRGRAEHEHGAIQPAPPWRLSWRSSLKAIAAVASAIAASETEKTTEANASIASAAKRRGTARAAPWITTTSGTIANSQDRRPTEAPRRRGDTSAR